MSPSQITLLFVCCEMNSDLCRLVSDILMAVLKNSVIEIGEKDALAAAMAASSVPSMLPPEVRGLSSEPDGVCLCRPPWKAYVYAGLRRGAWL